MKFKKLVLIASALMLAGSLAGCGEKKEDTKEPAVQTKTEEQEEKDTKDIEGSAVVEEEAPANQNLLTGLGDLSEGAIGKRPVAVMVNNVEKALPQYGVGEADLVFEIPVEGDATRLMTVYGDYTQVPKICPIRSCRYYFPALSQGFDAFYVNWGIDDTVGEYLQSLNLDQIDGIYNTGGLFGRDQNKLNAGYSLEHTGYFDGTALPAYIEAQGLRTDLAEDKKEPAFQFNGLDEQVKPEGSDCSKVKIDFGAQSSSFIYDTEKKVYLKEINGKAQIEETTGEQLSFTNLFILETDISVRDDIGHKEINWAGGPEAKGYYVSNGGVQEITWEKEGAKETSYLKFFDKDGQEIRVNRGKSYIALNYKDQTVFE